MVACLVTACTTKAADSGDNTDSSSGDSVYVPSCTCDPVCGELICASCGGCDDANPMIGPWCEETCNGIDDNCDAAIDEGVQERYFRDADGDGYGDGDASSLDCDASPGFVSNADDCNDADTSVWTGAPETCGDGVDQDCDGMDAPCQ